MSVITAEIPDSVRVALDTTARREHKSTEQVASESLARVVQSQRQLDYLEERAKLGHREDFEAFLAKVPDVPASPDDKI